MLLDFAGIVPQASLPQHATKHSSICGCLNSPKCSHFSVITGHQTGYTRPQNDKCGYIMVTQKKQWSGYESRKSQMNLAQCFLPGQTPRNELLKDGLPTSDRARAWCDICWRLHTMHAGSGQMPPNWPDAGCAHLQAGHRGEVDLRPSLLWSAQQGFSVFLEAEV
jgi:hypothetical protein